MALNEKRILEKVNSSFVVSTTFFLFNLSTECICVVCLLVWMLCVFCMWECGLLVLRDPANEIEWRVCKGY